MRKNGFTLIELLAVIVILAIIALIAVPIIIDIIEDSKKEALKRSAENYLKAVELSIEKENLTSEFSPDVCTITSGTTKCGDKTLNVTVDGELPESGIITLQNGIIVKTGETTLTYKSGTLTYDSNGKLTIETSKKELIAEGVIIPETTNGVAVNVDNSLVYYVPEGSNEAIVIGYYGNTDYSGSSYYNMNTPQTSGDIEIASKVRINGAIYPVTGIGVYAFSGTSFMGGAANITSVIIPSSVTIIGAYAFKGCTNLTSVTIPRSVTSIGQETFYNTPWLKSQDNGLLILNNKLIDGTAATGNVVIPSGVTTIGSNAFYYNSEITSVTIPKSVTSIEDGAFMYCSNLSSITIPESVTSIGGSAFDNTSWILEQTMYSQNGLVIVNHILLQGRTSLGDVNIPEGGNKYK